MIEWLIVTHLFVAGVFFLWGRHCGADFVLRKLEKVTKSEKELQKTREIANWL